MSNLVVFLSERDNVVGLCTSPSSVLREGLETSLKAKNLKVRLAVANLHLGRGNYCPVYVHVQYIYIYNLYSHIVTLHGRQHEQQ